MYNSDLGYDPTLSPFTDKYGNYPPSGGDTDMPISGCNYNAHESHKGYAFRHGKFLRAMLGAAYDDITKLNIESSHIADYRRAKTLVSNAAQQKLESSIHQKAEWTEVDETTYGASLALVKSLDKDIAIIENRLENKETTPGKTNGNPFIFGKGQQIQNNVTNGRYSGLGLGDLLRGLVLGANGNSRIQNALAEGTNSAGGYTVPTQLLPGFLDLIRNKSVLAQAGAATVILNTNKTSMATVLSDPTPAWRAENSAVAESDVTFGQVLFQPKSLAVVVKVSRELLADSLNIEEILTHTMAQAVAAAVDYAGLYGSGAANQPLGLKSVLTTNNRVGPIVVNGSKLSMAGFFRPLMVAAQKVAETNDSATTAIMSSRTKFDILDFVDANFQPMQTPGWINNNLQLLDTNVIPNNLESGTSTAITSEIFVGNFANLLLGMRQELEIEVLKEAYSSNLQVGFLASMRADWQVARPNSFWLTQGILAE